VWALSCITGARNLRIKVLLVIDPLKFILDIFKVSRENKAAVFVAFLFLTASS
jgi:hypothetical protein